MAFQPGCSNADISSALGVTFSDSTDLVYGFIFVERNEIVYKEFYKYEAEKPNKFTLNFWSDMGGQYIVFPVNDVQFIGEKYYYDKDNDTPSAYYLLNMHKASGGAFVNNGFE